MRTSLVLILLLAGLTCRPLPAQPATPPPVKLAVLVVVDQLRGDYLARWRPLFSAGGFKRLMRQGVWFEQCHYPYAATFTGPGHASVATGCSPHVHGVIANNWYDRDLGESVYCATEPRYTPVPRPQLKPDQKMPAGGSPGRLLAPTLADALKASTATKGRVFSLSMKDRSAILPGGKQPDFCLWFSSEQAMWINSTYYKEPPAWATAWNKTNPAAKYFDRVWEKLPNVDHVKYAGPDDAPGEGASKSGFGPTFPHRIVGDKEGSVKSKTDAVLATPFGNDLLFEAVEKLFAHEKPGTGTTPELLALSFSSNDLCGHVFGPDSQEVLDMTLRTDALLERLLNLLDAKVGKGNYSVAFTADHGVAPLPEVAAQRGQTAHRVDLPDLRKRASAYLRAALPAAVPERVDPIAYLDYNLVYFNPTWLKNSGLEPARVEDLLARWLRAQPGLSAAFTRSYLQQPPPSGATETERLVRQSWYPARSGAIQLVEAPYSLLTPYPTGTSHGTPHTYDRHVPLLVLAPGLAAPGHERTDPVTPQAAAAILARTLGIEPPAQAEVGVPAGLFR